MTVELGAMLKSAPKPQVPLDPAAVEWLVAREPVPYQAALETMDARAAGIAEGVAPDCVWLVEHPSLYTAGTSATDEELLEPGRFPVFKTGRGGRYTYHGPGQRITYVMVDLSSRGRDVRAYVAFLENWLIATLARLGVEGEQQADAVGIFVGGAKIASIGVRVRRWVTLHGVSLNVDPDLTHFAGIVPCGLHDTPVTSLAALGAETDRTRVDEALRASFLETF